MFNISKHYNTFLTKNPSKLSVTSKETKPIISNIELGKLLLLISAIAEVADTKDKR